MFAAGAPGSVVKSSTLTMLTIDVPGSVKLFGRLSHNAHNHHWLVTMGAPTKLFQVMLP